MLNLLSKTPYCFRQTIHGPDWHMLNTQRGLDLCIADDIVFSELLHSERIEGEVEPTAKFGDAIHQSFGQAPDVCFLSHCLADDCNQFIGGKGVIVFL